MTKEQVDLVNEMTMDKLNLKALRIDLDAIRTRCQRYEKALKFYADRKHMGLKNKSYMRSDCYAVEDGEIAREVLEDK